MKEKGQIPIKVSQALTQEIWQIQQMYSKSQMVIAQIRRNCNYLTKTFYVVKFTWRCGSEPKCSTWSLKFLKWHGSYPSLQWAQLLSDCPLLRSSYQPVPNKISPQKGLKVTSIIIAPQTINSEYSVNEHYINCFRQYNQRSCTIPVLMITHSGSFLSSCAAFCALLGYSLGIRWSFFITAH